MSDVKRYTVYVSTTKEFTVEVETDDPDSVRELAYAKVERECGYFDDWEVEEITEVDE